MKYGYTLLYVADVEATLSFYELAFSLKRKMYHKEGDQEYGELDTGPTTLGFVSLALAKSHGLEFTEAKPGNPAAAFEVGLVTDNVEAAFQHAVDHGAVAVLKPKSKPWGQVVSYVRDNNGFLVEICSPVVPPK